MDGFTQGASESGTVAGVDAAGGTVAIHLAGLPVEPLAASGLLGLPPTEGVLMHPETMEVVRLDRVGFTFWRVLRDTNSLGQAAELLAETYNVAPARIAEDLVAFVHDLNAQGLVVKCPPRTPAQADRMRITAILAAHNRRPATVGCLRSLFACVPVDCDLTAVLVDDGSTDGTTAAVTDLKLPITVVSGPGDWYWSRSMAEAEKVAELTDPDVILWLNDDVELDPTTLRRALETHRQHPEAILVGALWSPQRGDVSFTGMHQTQGEQGSTAQRVAPNMEPQPIYLFHGNFVLVPRTARRAIGPIDGSWPHHYADLDYAERASAVGVPVYLLPGLVGVCEPEVAAWLDPDVPWPSRVRALFGRKGWPPRAQLMFHQRHRRHTRLRDEVRMYFEALTGASVQKPPRARLLTVSLPPQPPRPPQWRPTAAADLIRLGPARDGGYVVSRSAVLAARHLISGGLSDDWAFEAAFRELTPVPVTVYDGTMGWTFWVSRTWQGVRGFLRPPSGERSGHVSRYLDYRRFFAQRGVQHVARNLTATGVGACSILEAFDRVPDGDVDVFVKLDIEGGEYALLGGLLARRERIAGLVMELHLVGAHGAEIWRFIEGMDTHVLTFVRANNAGGVDDTGRARILEMTWTRRDLFVAGEPDWAPLMYRNVGHLPHMVD